MANETRKVSVVFFSLVTSCHWRWHGHRVVAAAAIFCSVETWKKVKGIVRATLFESYFRLVHIHSIDNFPHPFTADNKIYVFPARMEFPCFSELARVWCVCEGFEVTFYAVNTYEESVECLFAVGGGHMPSSTDRLAWRLVFFLNSHNLLQREVIAFFASIFRYQHTASPGLRILLQSTEWIHLTSGRSFGDAFWILLWQLPLHNSMHGFN